mgnify:FL=1
MGELIDCDLNDSVASLKKQFNILSEQVRLLEENNPEKAQKVVEAA